MKSSQSSLRLILLCASLMTGFAPLTLSIARAQDTSESGSELTNPSLGESESVETPEAALEEAEIEEEVAEVEAEQAEPAQESATTTEPATTEEAAAAPVDEGEAQAAPASQPSPFRGSLFGWQQGLSVNTLNPDAQLSYNPTYYWSFTLQPRYYIDRQNFLVLTAGLGVEWTDNDISATEREPQLSDLILEWRHTETWEGFVFIPSVRLQAPTSMASIAADRVINTGVNLTVVRVFPELASLTFALVGGYRHWFAASNVPTINFRGNEVGTCSTTAGFANCDQASPFTTERDRLFAALSVTVMPLPGLTVFTQYAGVWIYGHELATADNPAVGGPPQIEDQSATHWRNGHYWTIAVGYDVVPWLNLQLGYQGSPGFTPWRNESGNVQNPLYYYDSELYLSATLALDVFVDEVFGAGEDETLTPEQLQRRRQGLASRGAGMQF